MILENDNYKVHIHLDDTYTIDSTDNLYYDMILNLQNLCKNDVIKVMRIQIDSRLETKYIAFIGSFYCYDFDCALLENHILTILQDNVVTQLDLNHYSVIKSVVFDSNIGCHFAIYKCFKGYIIYGELEIMMLDFNLKKKWSFTGQDIFVTQNDHQPFQIKNEMIQLYDWNNHYYELDFDGNLLTGGR